MRLILMRHAKSDWSSFATSDHDRPLNARGVRSARAMGDWMRGHGYLPDRTLCRPRPAPAKHWPGCRSTPR